MEYRCFVPYFPPRVGSSFLRHLDSPGELTLVTCLTSWWLYFIYFYKKLKRSLYLNGDYNLQEMTDFSLFSLSNSTPIVLISTVGVGLILSRFPINRSPGQKVGNTKRMIYFLVISIQFSCVHAMHIITIVAIVIYQGRKHVLSL